MHQPMSWLKRKKIFLKRNIRNKKSNLKKFVNLTEIEKIINSDKKFNKYAHEVYCLFCLKKWLISMIKKKIKISVICPVYNGEKFITKTIRSILNQSILPDEVIFCDDGSTDNSYLLIKKYKNKFLKKNKISYFKIKTSWTWICS